MVSVSVAQSAGPGCLAKTVLTVLWKTPLHYDLAYVASSKSLNL